MLGVVCRPGMDVAALGGETASVYREFEGVAGSSGSGKRIERYSEEEQLAWASWSFWDGELVPATCCDKGASFVP